MRRLPSTLLVLAAVTSGVLVADESILPGSVNDLMLNEVTPVTNTIWSIENPQSEADWQTYADAAQRLVTVAKRIREGGTGPNDDTWAADPAWDAWADALIESGEEMRAAAEARDLDTYIDISNDKMYPPCEECHIRFHPDMQQ